MIRSPFLLMFMLVAGLSAFSYASLPISPTKTVMCGRLTDTSNPLGQKKTYHYDRMSRATEVKDPAGNMTAFTYDALNRLTKKDIQTPAGERSVTDHTYDAVGNLLSASNASSSVSFVYDALNRAVETTQAFAGKSYSISYAYDAVGNRTSMTTPWGKYTYTYDALNRQTGIVNPQGINVSFGYDAVGRRTSKKIFKTTPELLAETSYSYDAAGQLLNITNKAGGKVVAFNNYGYDAAGNRTRMEDQNGIWNYKYDASNRLIVAIPEPRDMVKAEAFVYDKNGNRRFDKDAFDYKYDVANRLLENSTFTYTHDLNGNLISRTNKSDNSAITYAYNPDLQLSEVIAPGHKAQYKYDPLGRRIEKAVDGNVQRYVYDNEDMVAILDGRNILTETFTHGPGVDEPLVMTKADGKNYYYHADGLGSIKSLTDENNQIVETYTYKAYGEPRIQDYTGVVLTKSAIDNVYLFTAREFDAELELYYYRARYYDWLRGAFIREDPVGLRGGDINFYSYVRNSPANFVDPNGKWIVGGVGVVLGATTGGLGNLAGQLLANGSDFDSVNWKDVGVSAVGGGVSGLLMTTPMSGTLKGATVIGATVNIATYLATITPSQYSFGGALIAGGTGAVSGWIGGKIANPFMFGEMSPGLNSLAVVNKVFTGESFGRDFLGNTVGTYLESLGHGGCAK